MRFSQYRVARESESFWRENTMAFIILLRVAERMYRPHFCRSNIKQFGILYRGTSIRNSLPISLTSSSSIFVFFKTSEKLGH